MAPYKQPIKCGHCNENSEMNLIDEMSHLVDLPELPGDGGYKYHLLECPKCKNVTIARFRWTSQNDGDVELWEQTRYEDFLFPPNSLYSVDVLQKDPAPWFIDPTRIKELSNVKYTKFDLCKLIKLCKEINNCYTNGNLLAVMMLIRALLDHVPPIFVSDHQVYKNFSEVANNYKGSKSFRESMVHLNESSRKIADSYLHIQIRHSETLPNKTQVNFHNDLDVLLAEIVRVIKN